MTIYNTMAKDQRTAPRLLVANITLNMTPIIYESWIPFDLFPIPLCVADKSLFRIT